MTTTGGKRASKKATDKKKLIETLPSPTQWVDVASNHIPLDTLLLVSVDQGGSFGITLGYKSSITQAWVEVNGAALEEDCTVVQYSIITSPLGMVVPIA